MTAGGVMKIWNLFLWPLSVLYGMGTRFRNCLFDWGILKAERYPVPVICIGNLAVGGTGKTPLTEYLICLLKKHFRIAVVSRGYKRSSRGYLLATLQHSYHDIGDEPYQMRHKFPDILIAIDANRRRAIRNLLSLPEAQRPEVILLDDAFQHRYVSPSFSILLTNYRNMFYQDRLLPLGRLRESESGKQRADVVIVSKTPEDLKPIEYRIAETNMHLMAHQNVFFTYINYGEMQPVFPEAKWPEKELTPDTGILLLTGIAFPRPFVEEVKKWNHEMQVMSFPDHHDFKEGDIRKVQMQFQALRNPHKILLTTEKDATRLLHNPYIPEQLKPYCFYLPIRVRFQKEKEEEFEHIIMKHIKSFQQNNKLW